MDTQGDVFQTGLHGGSVLVGALSLLQDAAPCAKLDTSSADAAPFALISAPTADDAYAALSAELNKLLYDELFRWVPLYKESGGFSTFRFDDFLDKRVRRLLPSMRRLLFRATAPSTLGQTLDELPAAGDKLAQPTEWAKAFSTRAARRAMAAAAASSPLPFALPSLSGSLLGCPPYDDSDAVDVFESALPEPALRDAAATVEQTARLVCEMLAAAQRHPRWGERLAAEQKAATEGVGPEAPIERDVLAAMPELRAFALETLRLHPPARPARLVLEADLVWGGLALTQGTLLVPEPLIGHMCASSYREAETFNPERFLGDAAEPAPAFGFGGVAAAPALTAAAPPMGAAAAEARAGLAVDVACAVFVQTRRMFEVRLSVSDDGSSPRGVDEGLEALLKPTMYYELKRGVRQLKF